MLKSFLDFVGRDRIAGWVLDPERADEALTIGVFVDGTEIVRGMANKTRPDLRGMYGNGDHGFEFRLDPPLAERRSHYISIRADTKNTIVHERVLPGTGRTGGLCEGIEPIVLSATGRSGTTVMMKKLSEDPSVVVAGNYPYELKLLTYYAQALRVLSAPAYDENWTGPGEIHSERTKVGPNPFFNQRYLDTFNDSGKLYDLLGRRSAARLAQGFSDVVRSFYDEVGREQKKRNPMYFLEKCDVLTGNREYVHMLFPSCREIILVRDLRDVYCSSKSFWKVGESFIPNILQAKAFYMQIKREKRDNILVVRYEDFVQNEHQSLKQVSDFLELGRELFVGSDIDSALFERHGTSSAPKNSVGRWKTDLSIPERRMFRGRLDDFLEAYGYELDLV